MRYCGGCDRLMRHADILCPYCIKRIAPETRRRLTAAWKAFNQSFSTAAMAEYDRQIKIATREAILSRRAESQRLA